MCAAHDCDVRGRPHGRSPWALGGGGQCRDSSFSRRALRGGRAAPAARVGLRSARHAMTPPGNRRGRGRRGSRGRAGGRCDVRGQSHGRRPWAFLGAVGGAGILHLAAALARRACRPGGTRYVSVRATRDRAVGDLPGPGRAPQTDPRHTRIKKTTPGPFFGPPFSGRARGGWVRGSGQTPRTQSVGFGGRWVVPGFFV